MAKVDYQEILQVLWEWNVISPDRCVCVCMGVYVKVWVCMCIEIREHTEGIADP